MTRLAERLGWICDVISSLMFIGAIIALWGMAGATCFEVISRYFLNSPTEWTADVVSYLLCISVFLAIPEVTRRRGHVSVEIGLLLLPDRGRAVLEVLISSVVAAFCLAGAWISGAETLRQIQYGVLTFGVVPIPRYWISVAIPIGLAFAAVYFSRNAWARSTDALRGDWGGSSLEKTESLS